MLKRIARSGLKGRPRQTKILFVALGLAFFFVTLSFLLLSTANQTRNQKRVETFGDWQAVYANESPENFNQLTDEADDVARVRLIGHDDVIGLVGTADQAFWDMSHIKLIEGRLPEAVDEIVIEQGQLSYFSESPQVGDTILVSAKIRHGDTEEDQTEMILQMLRSVEQDFMTQIIEHWDAFEQSYFEGLERAFENIPDDAQFIVDNAKFMGREVDYDEELDKRTRDLEEIRDIHKDMFERAPSSTEERRTYFRQFLDQQTQHRYEQALEDEQLKEDFKNVFGYATEETFEDFVMRRYGPDSWLFQFVENVQQASIIRNTPVLEGFSGTTLQTRTRAFSSDPFRDFSGVYMVEGYGGDLPKEFWPELPEYEDMILSQEVVMIREMKLVGITEDYHTMWDGPIHLYPTAFVTPETGSVLLDDAVAQSKVETNQTYVAGEHFFLLNEVHLAGEGETYFVNQLARDAASGISEDLISRALLLVFGLITGFSIYQISLVQLKKRQRKFALMRSIGATLGQIRRLMSWEALLLLMIALPLGVGLAFLIAWLLIQLNNQLMSDQVQLVFEPLWLMIGIVITLIASLIGLFLPLRRLEAIPLRGQIEVIDQGEAKKARQILGESEIKRQSLSSINRRHYRFIRKQRLISTLLYSLILFILLGSLWLIFLSFQEYRTQVLDTDMPDFEFVRGHQVAPRHDALMMDELSEAVPVQRQDLFIRGEKAFLWYEDIADNELLNHLLNMLPQTLRFDYYSTELNHVLSNDRLYLTKEAMVVDVFSLDTKSDYIDRFRSIVPSDFDWEAYERGEFIILLTPGYELRESATRVDQATAQRLSRSERMKALLKQTGTGFVSYDPRRTPSLKQEPTLESLKTITLTVPTGELRTVDQIPTNTVNVYELPVGLVLNHLPRQGLWPISSNLQNPVVLLSREHMQRVYPNRMHIWGLGSFTVSREHRTERYANTVLNLYLNNPTADQALAVKRIGLEYDYTISNLYLIKQRLYAKGLQTSLIVALLGLGLLIVSLQIQTTSARGLLESERSRIGILQSLGVKRGEYQITYLIDAIKRVMGAIIVTHIALLVIIGLYLLLTQPSSNLLLEMQISLSDYPWLIHGLIVLAFLILGTLAAYLPLGNILKRQPVDNIRSLH